MDLIFMDGIFHQGIVASETTTFGCVSPDMPNHTQTCLDLLWEFSFTVGVWPGYKYFGKEDEFKKVVCFSAV